MEEKTRNDYLNEDSKQTKGNKSKLNDGLNALVGLANEFEKEGAFLDTPTGYSADKAVGQAYKDCAKRIRETLEETRGI